MATTTTEHIRQRVLGDHPAVHIGSAGSEAALGGLPPAEAFLLSATTGSEEQPCIDPPGRIRNNLFIGSRETENSLGALQAAGITHILQAGGELTPSFPGQFVYKHLSIGDEEDEDIVEAFKESFEFIDEARKKGERGMWGQGSTPSDSLSRLGSTDTAHTLGDAATLRSSHAAQGGQGTNRQLKGEEARRQGSFLHSSRACRFAGCGQCQPACGALWHAHQTLYCCFPACACDNNLLLPLCCGLLQVGCWCTARRACPAAAPSASATSCGRSDCLERLRWHTYSRPGQLWTQTRALICSFGSLNA